MWGFGALGVFVVMMLSNAFSGALGIDTPTHSINQNARSAAVVEGTAVGNWYEPGMQRNEESGGMPADPAAVVLPSDPPASDLQTEINEDAPADLVDVSANRKDGNKATLQSDGVDRGVVTVLSHD